MQMFDRLKKTVSSTVNSVIGNPVCREYEVGAQMGSCGPGCLWKIYDGRKKSTGQEVSVFVFEKKVLEKMEKRSSELVLQAMKSGPTHLARLRHPRLLVVQHPLEESRDSLAFATEPVFSSLSNILGNHNNFTSPVPKELKDYELYDVEKVYGLYQVVEGLIFLHNDAKRLHGNLTTESVVVTKNGQWKIAGLHFSKLAVSTDVQLVFECQGWDSQLNALSQPELNYTAPEHVLSRNCFTSSDMFSLGILIYAIYNSGKPLFDCEGDIVTYKRHIEKMSRHLPPLGSVPADVQDQVKCLVSISPELRPDAHQISKITYFDNVAAQTLHYLDTLMQRDNMTKSQFFKSLYKIISMLPKRVVIQRVLPHLCLEFSNQAMIPFVLPNVLLIAENCTDEEYSQLIFPQLKPVLKIQDPVQVVLILLKKMDLLLTKTPKEAVQFHVLPMVFQALEAPSDQVQELVLTIIPNFAKMIEYSAMKHSIIPRIKTLCLKTSNLSVRVNCLVCLGKIMEFLDKFLVVDEVFPVLAEIPSREPAVCMAILGIFKQTMVHKKLSLDKDYIARSAVPFLLPLAVEPALNISQFSQFMSVIRDLINRVETEQKAKLKQLKQMQEETKSSLAFAQEVQQSKEMDDLIGKVTNLFSGSTEPNRKVAEKPQTAPQDPPNGSVAFNKFFGFGDASQSSQNTQELASLSVVPKKSQKQVETSMEPFGSIRTSSAPSTSSQLLQPSISQTVNHSSLSHSNSPSSSRKQPSMNSMLNVTSISNTKPNNTGFRQPNSAYSDISNGFPSNKFSSFNSGVMSAGSTTTTMGNLKTMSGPLPMGMTSGITGPQSYSSSMTSSTLPMNSTSLNSIEIPGFIPSENQSKSLNQMRSGGPQQSLIGSSGLPMSRPLAPAQGTPPLLMNQSFNVGPKPLAPSTSTGKPPSNSTDLLDIFG